MQEDSRPHRGLRRPQSGGGSERKETSRELSRKRGPHPLDSFHVHQLVLSRNVNRPQPFWPVRCDLESSLAASLVLINLVPCGGSKRSQLMQAIVVEPSKEAPEIVRRQMQPGKLCVMFYGPAANKVRDCCFCLRQPSRTCSYRVFPTIPGAMQS